MLARRLFAQGRSRRRRGNALRAERAAHVHRTPVIMLPTDLRTHNPIKAWEAGLAWGFIIGVIILAGAFVGPTIRKLHAAPGAARHPRRHLDHLHLDAAGRREMWEATWIALPVFVGDHRRLHRRRAAPGQLPDRALGGAASSAPRSAGSAGKLPPTCRAPAKDIALGLPSLNIKPARPWPSALIGRCSRPRSRSASTTSPK